MTGTNKNALIFGGSGQIGKSLSFFGKYCSVPPISIRTFPWAWVKEHDLCGNVAALRKRIDDVTYSWNEFDMVFANGLLVPSAPLEELSFSNVRFPISVMEATAERAGIRYLTLGTVLEQFDALAQSNKYVRSKRELSSFIYSRADLVSARRVVHLRLHTLYGGPPKPHMFLGQMIQAIRDGTEFNMSSGRQLREYHHALDIAGAIANLLLREWDVRSEPLELNSGEAVRLADLAKAVFSRCGRPDQLRIGSLRGAIGENENHVFQRSAPWLLPYYRNPVAGVIEYVQACCRNSKQGELDDVSP